MHIQDFRHNGNMYWYKIVEIDVKDRQLLPKPAVMMSSQPWDLSLSIVYHQLK